MKWSLRAFFITLSCIIAATLTILFLDRRNIERAIPKTALITPAHDAKGKPKKILIFSSRGGGGHTSVSHALHQYLGDRYTMITTSVFDDILAPLDISRTLSLGRQSGERMYDYTLQRKWYWVTSFMSRVGSWYFNLRKRTVMALFERFITEHNPDLVISIVPWINAMAHDVCQKLDLPFLLMPTDLDITTFTLRIKKSMYDKFHLALPFDEAPLLEQADRLGLSADRLHVVGFPVKKQFLLSDEQRQVRKKITKEKLGIPQDKPTILFVMGAVGSQDMSRFSRRIADQVKTPVHLIMVMGRNKNLRRQLERIQFPSHITTTIVGFTHRMANLMAASDLLITKSGTVSVCEALYMDLPMFLDGTTRILTWELLNHSFITQKGFGAVIREAYDIPQMITRALSDDESKLDEWRENSAKYTKLNPETAIRDLVDGIIDGETVDILLDEE